jgi:hypothetical protein
MVKPTRRNFVAGAVAGMVAPGIFGGTREANAQLVWTTTEWKLAEFRKIVAAPARVKQMYNIMEINGGEFLGSIKNSLNGLHFGFGIPESQIKIVAAMHGPANMLNYDDYVWKKYKIGEWLKVNDPATGTSAEKNIFFPAASVPVDEKAANDPNNSQSTFQAATIQNLQARGVQFLSCHTATEAQARHCIHRLKLLASPEDVVQDMLAHTIPGTLVVASMVAAIALLQSEGRYTYMHV